MTVVNQIFVRGEGGKVKADLKHKHRHKQCMPIDISVVFHAAIESKTITQKIPSKQLALLRAGPNQAPFHVPPPIVTLIGPPIVIAPPMLGI